MEVRWMSRGNPVGEGDLLCSLKVPLEPLDEWLPRAHRLAPSSGGSGETELCLGQWAADEEMRVEYPLSQPPLEPCRSGRRQGCATESAKLFCYVVRALRTH